MMKIYTQDYFFQHRTVSLFGKINMNGESALKNRFTVQEIGHIKDIKDIVIFDYDTIHSKREYENYLGSNFNVSFTQ